MIRRHNIIILSLLAALPLISGCQPKETATPTQAEPTEYIIAAEPTKAPTQEPEQEPQQPVRPIEQVVLDIPLTEPLALRDAEISGMAWYGDYLILLPQYPNFFDQESSGVAFALPKEDLLAYVDGTSSEPLEPIQIPFDGAGLGDTIAGFEGYESIAFTGDSVYVTIEAKTDSGMVGFLVSGQLAPDLSAITLNPTPLVEIPTQSGVDNISDETLIVAGETLVTIHEANGVAVNPNPVIHVFDLSLNPVKAEEEFLALPNVEYRITDATALSEDNTFWAVNYFFPGDEVLKPEADPLAEEFGQGATHTDYPAVERLVEFYYHDEDGIFVTGTPPIQLEMLAEDNARNWEGIVRLDDLGFLLVTDKYPTTILGFVPLPERPHEETVTVIPVTEPLADRNSEIGAMDWYGDFLVMLPQYPNFFDQDSSGVVFAFAREDLIAYLENPTDQPLEPLQIPFDDGGLSAQIEGFEGYESIAFAGDHVYVTVEAETDTGMVGYLVSGQIAPDLSALTLDASSMASMQSQSGVDNLSYEALIVVDETLVVLHEANGSVVNEDPFAYLFATDLSAAGTFSITNIDYRVTDATRLGEDNTFWAINYFFPGEAVLKPDSDPLALRFGEGATHARYAAVERLVQFQFTDQDIVLLETAPIQLEMLGPHTARNWEAIAVLEGYGFLLATDKYPYFIFGFVPFP